MTEQNAGPFHFVSDELYAEGVSLRRIAADWGTPTWVYSRAAIESAWDAFDAAFTGQPHLVCYAVKANSNLGVLDILARKGAGFDIVSGGELARVIAAGGDPRKVIYSGVAKRADEIEMALRANIACFNVESAFELDLIEQVAGSVGKPAPVSLRINPDVDAGTHPYIATGLKDNKFGVPMAEAPGLYARADASPHLAVTGIDCHIGSQITSIAPFADALTIVLQLVDDLAASGIAIEHVDLGGGVGVRYSDETPLDLAEYASAIGQIMGNRQLELRFEPGRCIAADAGVLLCEVMGIKSNGEKRFAVVDAAMNDLLRPSLYGAWQRITNVVRKDVAEDTYDVVGPVCESGDFLAKERSLAVEAGDLLAVGSAGAYGAVMSSNYNTRGRGAELIVDGTDVFCARERETIADLMRLEHTLPP